MYCMCTASMYCNTLQHYTVSVYCNILQHYTMNSTTCTACVPHPQLPEIGPCCMCVLSGATACYSRMLLGGGGGRILRSVPRYSLLRPTAGLCRGGWPGEGRGQSLHLPPAAAGPPGASLRGEWGGCPASRCPAAAVRRCGHQGGQGREPPGRWGMHVAACATLAPACILILTLALPSFRTFM